MAGLVQSKSAIQTSGAATQALAFTGNVATGNAVIVVAGTQTVTDTLTLSDGVNTYTALAAVQNASANRLFRIFYALNVTGGALNLTLSGLNSPVSMLAIHELSGLTGFDASASLNGTGNSQDSGGATTVNANELLFGFTAGNPTSISAMVAGAGWLAAESAVDNTNGFAYLTQYKNVSAIGTYDSTSSSTVGKSGSLNWAAEITTFTVAAASTPVTLMAMGVGQ